ncbi:MAG: cobyrinate a,c-diamide synthase [Eubacteriales bacterium]|nr:cobyrinate a,c-diamide synthase [Eubacteriales bacterium]
MQQNVSRFLIAGAGSGCGKTTVTCAVLQAFVHRGLKTAAFKCGPDYIDPMFHSRVIGAESSNLDLFFFDHNMAKYLLARHGCDCDISVIEGVMGYYDGIGFHSVEAGSYDAAVTTDSPVVLVVGAKGRALSALAELEGFYRFFPDSRIRGVIFNRCSAESYRFLSEEVQKRFGGQVLPMGYLPEMKDCMLESRHLGLVTASEVADLEYKLSTLSEQAEKSLDLDGLYSLAKTAPPICCDSPDIPRFTKPVRIAVAMDKAFCFYYEDNLRLLREMGAELLPFSPLADGILPDGVHGIYLGGGYPELYARELNENETMRCSVRKALEQGVPCIAECGGFMYLSDELDGFPMVGFLPGKCHDTGKLTRFGYVTLTAQEDNLLCRAGETIRAHEFHRWDADLPGSDFCAEKLNGRNWDCAFASPKLYAGFPHFHFYANLSAPVNFYKACLKEREKNA